MRNAMQDMKLESGAERDRTADPLLANLIATGQKCRTTPDKRPCSLPANRTTGQNVRPSPVKVTPNYYTKVTGVSRASQIRKDVRLDELLTDRHRRLIRSLTGSVLPSSKVQQSGVKE